jgi:hypothetical protein
MMVFMAGVMIGVVWMSVAEGCHPPEDGEDVCTGTCGAMTVRHEKRAS